ncbi:MAG: peptide-methionine (S)-S-oxide reductase [Candidatus Fonsibacter ubiquis]|nr:peptide-methionine (S)-S-oxide reductase [Candidatus Fonsibacter ubiquis]
MNIAIFAAGCFWGVEKKFDLTKGVTKVEVGYTGGKTQNPTYEQVCYEDTAIFYLDEKQRTEAEESKKKMNETIFNNNIVTEIKKFDVFYLAEEYHQKYLKKLGKY